MDRNEFSLRVEALKAAMHQHDFEKAVEIADDLDLRKIRDNNLLGMVADAYESNHEYNRAKDALLTAYENTNAGRQLAYRLCLISIKTKEYDEAEEFYEDFIEMAPRDTGRYILKYQMAKAKGEPIESLIKILEEYVNIDMEEKWAYELTKLYHMIGEQEKCIDMCDEISLWFSEGKYVLKALELKKKYVPLSAAQKIKYEEGKKKEIEEVSKEDEIPDDVIQIYSDDKVEPEVIPEDLPDDEEVLTEVFGKNANTSNVPESVDLSKFDTMDIQAVVAEGMKELDFNEENLHEGAGATKVAEGKIPFHEVEKPKESDMAFMPGMRTEVSEEDILEESDEQEEKTPEFVENEISTGGMVEIKMEPQTEKPVVEEEKEEVPEEQEETSQNKEEVSQPKKEDTAPLVESLDDVQNILKRLQEKGILKAETVQQAVTIIEEAGNEDNKGIEEEFARIDQGLDEEEDQQPDVSLEDAIQEVPEEVEESEAVAAEESEEVEEPEVVEEPEESVVSKETIAIPNLDMIRKEVQDEADAEQKAEEEARKAEEEERAEIERQREEQKAQTLNHIPILDLTQDPPARDTSSDVGKEGLYENIVANSDLGNITDKIPSREEIEKAIRDAEENEQKQQEDGLRATASLSAAVEIISGASWNQGGDEEPDTKVESEEVEEKESTETEEPIVEEPENDVRIDAENAEIVAEEAEMEEESDEVTEEAEAEEESNKVAEEAEAEEESNKVAEEAEAEEESDEVVEEAEAEEESDEVVEEAEAEEESDKVAEEPEVEKESDEVAEETEAEENEEAEHIQKNVGIHLSDEDMSVFKHYLNVEGLEDSIRETVEDLIALYTPDGKSTEGNVIILGDKRTGKTTLAIEIVKLVNKKRGRKNRKLAKVNATTLNKRGFRNSLSKLIGCDLIVEYAHELGVMTISEIIDCSGMFTDDMLIVLEGNKEGMQNLLKITPRITEVFNHVIHIREYNIKEWVEYGKRYAEEKGYAMDELASLAFYKAIDDCFGEKKGINQESVEAILDDAIARRSRKLFGAKKNEDGLIILIEKNFR